MQPEEKALVDRLRQCEWFGSCVAQPISARHSVNRVHWADDAPALAAAAIESLSAQVAELQKELDVRKGDPVTRLHNICRGLEYDKKDSPYSGEAG